MAPSKNNDKTSGLTAFEARVAALHTHLLGTLTAHTLKDLEKSLPSAVHGISGMNAKDHIQALVDENLLHVEKIGTGNWYWCFGSEDRVQRTRNEEQVLAEQTSVKSRIEALQLELEDEKSAKGGQATEEDVVEREHLVAEIEKTDIALKGLKEELSKFEDGDPAVLQTRRDQTRAFKDAAEIWTENCWALEGWMRDSLGLRREDSVSLLKECYGDEFVDDDGGLNEVA